MIQLVRLGRRRSVFDNGVRCGALGTDSRLRDGAHADGARNGSLCDGARAVTSAAVSTRSSSPREFFGDPGHLSQYSPPVSRSQGITGTSSAASPVNSQLSGSARGGFSVVDDIRKNGARVDALLGGGAQGYALLGDGAPTGTFWDDIRGNGARVDALLSDGAHGDAASRTPSAQPSTSDKPAWARNLVGEARNAALLDMSDDPALTRAYLARHDEPASLHDLLEESDDEMPPEQRKRGMSVKKRRRSRKPGSQRNRDSA